MREIKFRGKGVISDDWFIGSLIVTKGSAIIYSGDFLHQGSVNPKTIGQYTGLKDKNGKEIYEGDIIGCHNPQIKHLIFYNEKQGRFMAALNGDIENYYIGVCGLDDSRWIASKEVIGNIHDNPELIKEEQK